MIAGHFCGHELISLAQPVGKTFAHFSLLVVANARWHGACWQKDGGQMPKGGRRNHQARNDLITNAQENRRVKSIVRQANGGGQCNCIA